MPYDYDPETGRYRRRSDGRPIAPRQVRYAVDLVLRAQSLEMRALAGQLQRKEIGLVEWEFQMRQQIKSAHLTAAAAAKGGWAQMTAREYGRVGRIVRDQYTFVNRLAAGLDAGDIKPEGRFLARVQLYAQAARKTYHAVEATVMTDLGHDEERSVRHPADSCDECIEEEALGWVPIGTLIPIGERTCLSNCRCTMEYRTSSAGASEEAAA